jgi:trimeric autotransporter adhesin
VKTISLKKVSAVAVASLAFGTFTAIAPANAALTAFTISKNSASGDVLKVTAAVTAVGAQTSTTTATTITQAAITGNSTTTLAASIGKGLWIAEEGFLGTIATGAADYGTVTVSGVAYAAVAAATATYRGTVATTVTQSGIVADAITGMSVKSGAKGLLNIRGNGAVTGTAGVARFLVNGVEIGRSDVASANTDNGMILPFTAPLVAGTYVGSVQVTDGGTWAEAISQSFTLTVSASATLSPAQSTAHMTTPGANGANATALTNLVPRSAAKATGAAIAQVLVTLLKDDATADTTANTVSCIVSGVGFCIVNTTADTYAASTARSGSDSSAASVRYVHINTDGTAGTGTVTVSVTHASTAVETTLGTFSYTTYGDATKLEVTTKNGTIGKAGAATGGASATRVAAEDGLGLLGASTTVPAFIVKATDSAGRAVTTAAVPTVTSSNVAAVSGGTCIKDGGYDGTAANNDYKSSTNGVGFYNCNFTGSANAVSGAKATLTISITDPADASKKISTTLDVTIGGSVSTETIAFDKTSYAPGEAMVITRTAKDSAGNPVADGSSSPVVSFSKAVGGTAITAGFYSAGVSATATTVAKSKVFAPTVPGAFSALATSGNTAASAITAASSVTDANAGLLTQIDALNAKIVALNALIAKIMKKLGVK